MYLNKYHEGNENAPAPYDVCISQACAQDVSACEERECGISSELYSRWDRNQLLAWSHSDRDTEISCKFDQS